MIEQTAEFDDIKHQEIKTGIGEGNYLDFLNPDPSCIDIGAIATALSRQVRFCGLGEFKITVAEHSVNVSKIVLDIIKGKRKSVSSNLRVDVVQLAALLHDAHEAYIGDMPRPVLDYFEHQVAGFQFARAKLTNSLDDIIFARAGIKGMTSEERALVSEADDYACKIERAVTLHLAQDKITSSRDIIYAEKVKSPLASDSARQLFMERYHQLHAGLIGTF